MSFLFLRGRCRSCKSAIPRWHLWAELGGGVLLGASGALLAGRPAADLGLTLVALALLYALTVVDLRLFLLPDPLNGALAVVGLVRSLVLGAPGLGGSLAGGAVGFAALGLLAVIPWSKVRRVLGGGGLVGPTHLRQSYGGSPARSRGDSSGPSMGLGDVKLAAAMGVILGLQGVVTSLFLAFVVGGIVGLILIALRKATPKTRIPFGPFLAAGTAVTLLFPALPGAFFHFLGLA